MTTQRQQESNRANAQYSTGPHTSGGAGNARTHGLTAARFFSDEEKRLIEARRAEFESELLPEGALQRDEVVAMASASIRLERCVLEEQSWRLERAERAELYWDADLWAETMKLVKRLPKAPDVIVPKLRQSLRGCMWLLAEWRHLAGLVNHAAPGEAPRPLDENGRRRALDLLGLSAERRVGSTPFDLPLFITAGVGVDAELAAHQQDRIATEIAALEPLVSAARVAHDESIRIATVNGTNQTIDDRTRLIRRYESEARRVKERAYERLKALQEKAAALKTAAREQDLHDRQWIPGQTTERWHEVSRAEVIAAYRASTATEPPIHHDASAVRVETETPTACPTPVAAETVALMEEPVVLAATATPTPSPTPAAVAVGTVPMPRHLSRRARKAIAARAAHYSAH